MQDGKFGIKKTLCQIKYKVIISNNIIRARFFFNRKNSHKYGQESLKCPFMEDFFSAISKFVFR